MGKNVLPLALVMLVLLVLVTGFSASQGLHLQDGIYTLGVDSAVVGEIFSPDVRFTVYQADDATLWNSRESFDAIVIGGEVWGSDTDKGRAAVRALQTDYEGYLNQVYAQESDLFAAYPLWIDVQNVKSELDFTATLAGQQVAAPVRQSRPPVPSGRLSRSPPRHLPLASPKARSGRDWSSPRDQAHRSRDIPNCSPGRARSGITPSRRSSPRRSRSIPSSWSSSSFSPSTSRRSSS